MNLFQRWTRPYYGISHLACRNRRYQFTIHETAGGTAYGYMLDCESGKAFTVVKEIYAISVRAARKELESWAEAVAC
jgi:hypothetical protein